MSANACTHSMPGCVLQSALGSLSDIDWSRNMGRLRCHFVRSASFLAAAGKKAPAKASPVHLFMAKGPAENGNSLIHFFLFACLPHLSKVLFCLLVNQISQKPLNGFAPNSRGRRVSSLARTSLNVQRSKSPGTKYALCTAVTPWQ